MRTTTLTFLSLLLGGLAATGFAALRSPAAETPNLDQALTAQQALAAERPNDPLVLNDLGNLLLVAGRQEDAEQAYRQALEIAPEMTSAHYNMGLLLLQKGETKAALGHFRTVLDTEPDNAWAHYQVGVIFETRGQGRKAIRHYARAFRLDPKLAFPEVNPHVIDNDHVTKALLLAYRNLPSSSGAPKTYEEPSRIVSLMMAAEEEDGAAGDAGEGESEAGEAKPGDMMPGEAGSGEFAPRPSMPPAVEEGQGEEGGQGRVLRKEDLDEDRPINQARPQGGSAYYPPRGGVRQRSDDVRRRYQPPSVRSPGRRGGSTGSGDTRRSPSSGRDRFAPGIPSTGRLELELLPGPGGDRATIEAG